MYAYLLEVDAWTGTQVETLRLATHTIITGPADSPANTVYDGRIIDSGSFSRSLVSGGRLGRASASWGFIELANADGGLDAWINYGFDARAFALKILPVAGMPVSQATTLFRGTIAALESGNAIDTLRFHMRDRLAELAVPLLTTRYAGTSTSAGLGIEGDTDLQDQLKPRVFGTVRNIGPKLVNKYDLIYQVSAGSVSSIAVYDGMVPLTNAGNYAALSALLTASLAPGNYTTCFAQGLFRLGGTPAFAVTADVAEAASDRTAAGVAGRMLDLIGIAASDRDQASFSRVVAFNSAEVGIFVDAETNALDLIGQVLESIGAAIVPTATGLFQIIGLAAPVASASIGELVFRDLVEGGTFSLNVGPEELGLPAWSVVRNYGRIWQTLTEGQIAGVVDLATRTTVAAQWRQAKSEDATIKTKHPLATQDTGDSYLVQQINAQAETNRLLALYGVRRDLIQFPTDIDRAPYDLGDVVTLTLPRFGYSQGRPMLVVGRHDDSNKRTTTLELWGSGQ